MATVNLFVKIYVALDAHKKARPRHTGPGPRGEKTPAMARAQKKSMGVRFVAQRVRVQMRVGGGGGAGTQAAMVYGEVLR